MIRTKAAITRISVAAAAAILLAGCVTQGELAPAAPPTHTYVAPGFAFEPAIRVAVLPFAVTGHPERAQDSSAADILSIALAEAGFRILDSTILSGPDLNLEALVPTGDLAEIREALDIQLIAIGTINYAYDNGSQSLLGKGQYYAHSASVRLVSLTTGEVVVIATARVVDGSLVAALGDSIKAALGSP